VIELVLFLVAVFGAGWTARGLADGRRRKLDLRKADTLARVRRSSLWIQ
jgi:hypothetical protein